MNTTNLLDIPTSELAKLKGFSMLQYMIAMAHSRITSRDIRCPKKRAIAQQKQTDKARKNKEKYIKDLLTANGLL